MSERRADASPLPLRWEPLVRADGAVIEQARARNNSWYMIVPTADAAELRYASQAGNYLVMTGPREALVRAAEAHADTYDTRP